MQEGERLLMVTVSGPDRPGITADLTGVLVAHGAEVVDIEQASLQNQLGLYFLLDLGESREGEDSVIKDLLYEASKLGLTLHFRLFSQAEIKAVSERNLFVLTHFGGTSGLYELSRILGEEGVNIETISSVTHHGARSMEMVINVNGAPSLGRLKERIMLKSRELGMDINALKRELEHLIQVHPHVAEFLQALRSTGKRVALLTNAHQKVIDLKMSTTGLAEHFDHLICAHAFRVPKEDPRFWHKLAKEDHFHRDTTLFVDDSLPVLRSARNYGIKFLRAVRLPDSKAPPKDTGDFTAIESFDELVQGLAGFPGTATR